MESFLSLGRWLWSLTQRLSKKLSCVGATGFLTAAHVIIFLKEEHTGFLHLCLFLSENQGIGVSAYLWMPFTSVSPCFMIQFPSEMALTQNTLRATENESSWKGGPVRRMASSSQSIHSLEHFSVVCTSPSLTGEAARKKQQARAWPHSCQLLTVKVKETH